MIPFTMSELVPIILSFIRDIAFGIVELAFPESKPSGREDYREALTTSWPSR